MAVLTEVDRVRSSLVFHQDGCDVIIELATPFLARLVAHELDPEVVPPSRIARRTQDEQILSEPLFSSVVKVKGGATDEMVRDGFVSREDKNGNGATDESSDLDRY